jgi:hypothetical protein
VEVVGGRFSTEAGIDVDGGDREVDRWFLAATLFGTRISAAVAVRTYCVLDAAGVSTIADAGRRSWDDLVALLDQGGYARYDFRTARRLLQLSNVVSERYPSGIAAFGARCTDPQELADALDALPGWGPVTIAAFLRELRGVWRAARPALDARVEQAAAHLQLVAADRCASLTDLGHLAAGSGVDPRDLETALTRFGLAHERGYDGCAPGGCRFLAQRVAAR